MPKTLLQLVQQACNEIGIPEPSALVGAFDDQSKILLALANREGKDFSVRANHNGGWQALHQEYTFNTVAGVSSYDIPSDLEYFIDRTYWDDSYKWELLGPISAQEKQILRYGIIANGPRRKFIIRLGKMTLIPTPTEDGQLIAYDYYSNAWCSSVGGVSQSNWQADTDTYKLDEDCFIQGIKWRFLRQKGLDYSQEFSDYEMDAQRVMARDAGAADLSLNSMGYGTRLLDYSNIPSTGYGQ